MKSWCIRSGLPALVWGLLHLVPWWLLGVYFLPWAHEFSNLPQITLFVGFVILGISWPLEVMRPNLGVAASALLNMAISCWVCQVMTGHLGLIPEPLAPGAVFFVFWLLFKRATRFASRHSGDGTQRLPIDPGAGG